MAATASVALSQAATKRELAAQQFRKAEQLLEDLRAVPELELGEKQYDLVSGAFRKVHWITPSSSYCDDALFHAAETVAMKAERFGSDAYRQAAADAYRFLIREYPHSSLLAKAREEIARLEAGEAAPKPQPAPQDIELEPVQVTEAQPDPASAAPAPPVATPVSTSSTLEPLANRAQPSPDRTRKSLASVSDLRYFSQPDGVRIVVELDDYVPYKFDFLTRPHRLYFDFFTSRLAGPMIRGAAYEVGEGAVARVRLGQNRRTKARLVVDLLDEVTYDVSWLANPPRLVIQLQGKTPPRPKPAEPGVRLAEAAPAVPEVAGKPVATSYAPVGAEPKVVAASLAPPKPADVNSVGGQSLIRALGLKIGRVVIDPGHGGHDPGMTGPSGLREKDVVLDISMRLAKLIEDELGAEAILTRDSDRFIDLQRRTRAANDAKADLFVSVHANASNTRSVRGVETFYLSLTADSWALKVASRENAASDRSVAELQDLLGKIARNDTLDESRELAAKIQTAVFSGLAEEVGGQRNRGVRKAPLLVLMGAKMPAILAEVGFLSNPSDEKLFKTSKHRQFVAERIFAGVREYVESLSSHHLTMKETDEARAQLDD